MKEEIIRLLDECEKNLSTEDFKYLNNYLRLQLNVSLMHSNHLRVGFFEVYLNCPTDISVYYYDYSRILGGLKAIVNPDFHTELSREISPIHIDILKKLSSNISGFSYIMMRYGENGFTSELSNYINKDKSFQEVFDLIEEHFNVVYDVLNFFGELINQYSSLNSLDEYKKIIPSIIEDQKRTISFLIHSIYTGTDLEKLTEKIKDSCDKCSKLSDSEFLDLPEPDYTEIKDLGLSLKLQYYLDNDGKKLYLLKSRSYCISYFHNDNILEKLEKLWEINYHGLSDVSRNLIDILSFKLSKADDISKYIVEQYGLSFKDLNKIYNEILEYLIELGFILNEISPRSADPSFSKIMDSLKKDLFKLSSIMKILEIEAYKSYPSLTLDLGRKPKLLQLLIYKY